MPETAGTSIAVCPLAELPPGSMRLVEHDGTKIGVFNCDGTLYAIEDRCSHDDGPLAEGEFNAGRLHGRVPAPRLAVRPDDRQAEDAPRLCSGEDVHDGRRGRHHHPGGRVMATPEAVAEKRELAGINADYKEKFGFHDPETGYAYKAPKGLSREVVESISEYKDEPQWMRDFRLKALEHFEARPTPTWGGNLGQIDFDDIHYFVRASEKNEPRLGRGPGGHQEHLRPARDPRGGAQIPLRRRRPVRVRGRLPPGARGPREAGRDLPRHGHRPARARGHGPRVLGDGDPAQRQQAGGAQLGGLVGRLLRLRAEGRQGRDAASGLLPDQHREHGPVRADADHRRGGLRRPLHRGLHGAGLLDRLAALGGGRDHLQSRAPGSAIRPSRTGPRTSTTSSPSARSRRRRRRWSGSTATSARS